MANALKQLLGNGDGDSSPAVFDVDAKDIRDLIANHLDSGEKAIASYGEMKKAGSNPEVAWQEAIDHVVQELRVAKLASRSVADGKHRINHDQMRNLHKTFASWEDGPTVAKKWQRNR